MALSLPGLDNDVIAKLKAGDLGALEKLFRAAYPALVAKAKEVLDDDSAAARVVERLMPRLFAERAGLTSLADLSASMEGLVHEAAVRERSRLAGIRKRDDGGKGASGPAPTVDDVWGKIAAVIQGPTKDQIAAAEQMKDKLRHEAAGHIKQMTQKRPWYIAAGIGLVFLGVVAGGLFLFAKSGEEGRLARLVAGADAKELKTGTGQRGNITLNDGTTAKLGADTRVKVPAKFDELRGVSVEGAAEFTVAADPKPFQVVAKNVLVTAKGTVFAVSAYPLSNSVIITVKEGAVTVEVTSPEESVHEVSAGQKMIIGPDGKAGTPTDQQLAEALGYLEDKFFLGKKTLKEALVEIKRWYATDLFLQDTSMGSRMLDSVVAPLGSETDAIRAIEAASGLVFGWDGQTRVLRAKK